MNILLLVLILPLLTSVVLFLVGRPNTTMQRTVALGGSLVTFLVSLALMMPFLGGARETQFDINVPWVAAPKIGFHIGLDGLSVWLVLLSTLLTPLAVLISWQEIQRGTKAFYGCLLLLEFSLVGVFSSLDLFLFYVFFELSLVPMIFLIGIYGSDRRVYAALKFFLYTLAGSVLMLGSIIYLYNHDGAGTFDLPTLAAALRNGSLVLTRTEALWLFLGFFAAFAVKLALWPVHTWLPDAYTEAPTAATVMLAAVMTKMGTYGLVRFCLELFPGAARQSAPWILTLAVIGIIYGALVAIIQPNMKRLVAYSSVSHIGFIVLGIFSFTQAGMDGAVYQMLCHGISTGALFLLIGMLEQRRGSLDIAEYGGAATPLPKLATVFCISMLASVGLPLLCNFVGEYLILQGVAAAKFRFAALAAIGVILSACYLLWMYQRVFFGPVEHPQVATLRDIDTRELALIAPLILLMVWMGVATQMFLPSIGISNARILDQSKMGVEFQVQAPALQETAHAR